MKYSTVMRWCVAVFTCQMVASYAEIVEVRKKIDCYYCKGTGVAKEKVKETCPQCDGQGHFIVDNGVRRSISYKNCRACGSRGYRMVWKPTTCRRCNGVGFEYQTVKEERTTVRPQTQEDFAQRQAVKRNRRYKKQLAAFLEANTLNNVLVNSGVEGLSEERSCLEYRNVTNQQDGVTYKMKVIEVLPENRVVSDLVKQGLYDQKMGKMVLIETSDGEYSVNDYLKGETYYKFIGKKEYTDRFGRKKELPCLKEIQKSEYLLFAGDRVSSQL